MYCTKGLNPKLWILLSPRFRGLFLFVLPPAWLRRQSWGRILGRNPDQSLKSFPPCYSQSPLQLCLEISISSNSRNLFRPPSSCLTNLLSSPSHPYRKIRLTEGDAKCHLKKWPVKGLGRYLSVRGPEHHIPPPYTLYTSHKEGGEGRGVELNQREWERGNMGDKDHKAGLKIPTWMNVHKKLAISCL
jgi:hypothetical protein